jgi:hypothetical protein
MVDAAGRAVSKVAGQSKFDLRGNNLHLHLTRFLPLNRGYRDLPSRVVDQT